MRAEPTRRRALQRFPTALLLAALTVASAATNDALRLSGQARQGELLFGQTRPGAEVTLDGKPLPVTRDGHFVLGFGRDAETARMLRVKLNDGTMVERRLEPSKRDYRIERVDGLPPETVTPPPEVLERIRREAAQVAQARSRRDPRADWTVDFQWPATGRISGVYGSQRILNGEPRRPHYGIDIAAPAGTPVRAPAPGVITLAEPDLYFSGGTVILDHGHGVSSTFLHLSKVEAEIGERVAQGQVIGRVGASGRATGAHLDWRMNWRDQRVDPRPLVPPLSTGQDD